jgi:hypothetical protein
MNTSVCCIVHPHELYAFPTNSANSRSALTPGEASLMPRGGLAPIENTPHCPYPSLVACRTSHIMIQWMGYLAIITCLIASLRREYIRPGSLARLPAPTQGTYQARRGRPRGTAWRAYSPRRRGATGHSFSALELLAPRTVVDRAAKVCLFLDDCPTGRARPAHRVFAQHGFVAARPAKQVALGVAPALRCHR